MSPVRGVLHATHLEDGLELRIACLRLVVPDDAVITDRTAGWLHGAPMVLAPNDHLKVPPVSIFRSPGYRLRNSASASGERTFGVGDVVEIDGLRVTSKLRTTYDLGRLLRRDQAMAAMDSMMHVADFGPDVLAAQGERFRGGLCYLDLAVKGLRYAAEYDGARWHGPEQRAHDERRRNWLTSSGDWIIDVFVDADIAGTMQDAQGRLIRGVDRANRRLGSRGWHGQDRA